MKITEVHNCNYVGNFCRYFLICFASHVLFQNTCSAAELTSLEKALQNTYIACVGIDDKLSDLKLLAGINTGVQAVGTGLGVGATAVGIVKVSVDKAVETYEKMLQDMRKKTKNVEYKPLTEEQLKVMNKNFKDSYQDAVKKAKTYKSELEKLNKKSKKLGNWRTGLMAGATVTNVTGAILASQSGVNKDLDSMVKNCLSNVDELKNAMGQALVDGEDVTEAREIVSACDRYRNVDVSSVSKRATGAMASSVVGAATGFTGTIVSGVANSDKVRKDNTKEGKQKEKNLNTASNVLAGVTTAASGVATVFSGVQIAAIKRVADVAAKCEEALK